MIPLPANQGEQRYRQGAYLSGGDHETTIHGLRGAPFRHTAVGMRLCPPIPTVQEITLKAFPRPPQGMAGLYVYLNSHFFQGVRLNVYLDGAPLGKTMDKAFLYTVIAPGAHDLTTESEFGDKTIILHAPAGENLFVEQVMKLGMFSVRSDLKQISEQEGMKEIRKCRLLEPK